MTTPIFICSPRSKGEYFRLERQRLNLRQLDVAVMAGIPASYVSLAENDLYIPYWAMSLLEKALGFNNLLGNEDQHAD